jgi:hypothetical protein
MYTWLGDLCGKQPVRTEVTIANNINLGCISGISLLPLTLSSAAGFKANFYGILCEANHKKAT